jgi:hypothetical protein
MTTQEALLENILNMVSTPLRKRDALLLSDRAFEELKRQVPTFDAGPWEAGMRVIPCAALDGQEFGFRIQEEPFVFTQSTPPPDLEVLDYLGYSPFQFGKTIAFQSIRLENDFYPHVLTPHGRRWNSANGPRRGQRRLLALRKRRYAKRRRQL